MTVFVGITGTIIRNDPISTHSLDPDYEKNQQAQTLQVASLPGLHVRQLCRLK